MTLFDNIPDRLFTVLTSSKKRLYLDALFVVRDAFKRTDLIIPREELIAMFMEQLEDNFNTADFSEEIEEDGVLNEDSSDISGKVHMLLRHLINTGWVEEEEDDHFQRNITVPYYSIQIINLLYDISHVKTGEYNSYVYTTYAALKNAGENRDYLYQALNGAYRNTESLVEELKILFNNIKHYETKALKELEINNLLESYFDQYKEGIFDTIYFPLKTIDSVPRFKGTIISILNEWYANEDITEQIVRQGIQRKVYANEEDGREQTHRMINEIISTYETIEDMIEQIDHKHSDYTRVSAEKIRYMLNNDMSIKGKVINLLKRSNDPQVMAYMADGLEARQFQTADHYSMYSRIERTARSEGTPMVIDEQKSIINDMSFLKGLRNQYSNQKIDTYVHQMFKDSDFSSTELAPMQNSNDFIMFMLSTIRGKEKSSDFTIEFEDGYCENNGYHLPKVVFRRKKHV